MNVALDLGFAPTGSLTSLLVPAGVAPMVFVSSVPVVWRLRHPERRLRHPERAVTR